MIDTTLLPWHRKLWQRLFDAVDQDRLPHGLLLTGKAGLGKEIFAKLFSASLLCHRPRSDRLPCGECRSCRFLSAGAHPDFFHLAPEEKGRPIKIDAVREFVSWSTFTAQEGTRRVALIAPADAMNTAAANSLLKTLEEPPASLVILLVTSRSGVLPPTVRSRCQESRLHTPPAEQALGWLSTQLPSQETTDTETDWRKLLELSAGAPIAAKSMASDGYLETRNTLFREFAEFIDGNSTAGSISEKWSRGVVEQVLASVNSWLRDMIRLRMGCPSELLENADLSDNLLALGVSIDLRRLLESEIMAEYGLQRWQLGNLNAQMQLEDLLLYLVEKKS
jgi:DNA polymerase-3 subunit delta'